MKLTQETERTVRMLQRFKPFMLIYVCQDKDTGEQFASAVPTKRIPNKLAREGHQVAMVS